MIGFKEFFRINICTICDTESPENDFSDKMVFPLQNLFETILCQLELPNSLQRFKLKCLSILKMIVEDLLASFDYLHQHENSLFDFNSVIETLLGHIDVEHNLACSKVIFEILYILIGAKCDSTKEI